MSIDFSRILNAAWLTEERVRRVAHVLAVVGIAIISWDIWQHVRAGYVANGELLGRDFINYWAGAKLAADGHAASVYNIPAFERFQVIHTGPGIEQRWYAYPPVLLLLSLPLALFGFVPGMVLWIVGGFVAFGTVLSRILGWRTGVLAALATPAAYINIWSGQNGAFTAALMGGGIVLLKKRPYLAGVLFGMLCFKPHLAILVPIALAAGGYWRTFISAAMATVALVAASWLVLGIDSWSAFRHVAPLNAFILENNFQNWHRMPTIFVAVKMLGGSTYIAYLAQILSAGTAAILILRIWRRSAPLGLKGAALIVATFLTTPYGWDYDLVVLTIALTCYLLSADFHSLTSYEKYLLTVTLIMPAAMSSIAVATKIQVGPLLLWLVLGMIVRRTRTYEALHIRSAVGIQARRLDEAPAPIGARN